MGELVFLSRFALRDSDLAIFAKHVSADEAWPGEESEVGTGLNAGLPRQVRRQRGQGRQRRQRRQPALYHKVHEIGF